MHAYSTQEQSERQTTKYNRKRTIDKGSNQLSSMLSFSC